MDDSGMAWETKGVNYVNCSRIETHRNQKPRIHASDFLSLFYTWSCCFWDGFFLKSFRLIYSIREITIHKIFNNFFLQNGAQLSVNDLSGVAHALFLFQEFRLTDSREEVVVEVADLPSRAFLLFLLQGGISSMITAQNPGMCCVTVGGGRGHRDCMTDC